MASKRSCAEAAARLAVSPIKTRRKLPLPIVPCVQPIDPLYQWVHVKKSSKSRARTNILFPARQQDQMGVGAAGLVCGAIDFSLSGGRSKPGERNHAAGANPDARAGDTKRRKLLPQLLIALKQFLGVLPHHRHLLNKRRRSAASSGGNCRGRPGRFLLGWFSLSLAAV